MTRQKLLTFLLCSIISTSIYCEKRTLSSVDDNALATHRSENYVGTMDTIFKKKFLRVLTTGNDLNYFTHEGNEKGFEYFFINEFVKQLNKKINLKKRDDLKIAFEIIPVNRNEILEKLASGFGDIAAAGLTITDERIKKVNFSRPYLNTSEVLISPYNYTTINNLHELSGKKIGVRKSSSYFQHLTILNKQLKKDSLKPIEIIPIENDLDTISIIELLTKSRRKFDLTVADSHLADLAVKIFKDNGKSSIKIHNKVTISKNQKIAWAVNKKSGIELLKEINSFFKNNKQRTMIGNMNIREYFKGVKSFSKSFSAKNSSQISKYDSIVKKYTIKYSKEFKMPQIDWRLLSALMYQESKFNPAAKNPSGAVGLFQIKPSSALDVGIKDIAGTTPKQIDNNINAGIKYLYSLMTRYFGHLKGKVKDQDYFRIVIAAYNAGPGTAKRAIASTKRIGLNANSWFRNIEIGMLKLKKRNVMRSRETIEYVSTINKKYLMFVEMGYPAN